MLPLNGTTLDVANISSTSSIDDSSSSGGTIKELPSNSDFLRAIDNFLSEIAKLPTEPLTKTAVDHSAHLTPQSVHDHAAMLMNNNNMDHDEHMMMMMHNNHDMSSSMGSGDTSAIMQHHMMKMWFHGGYDEVILFDFWRINSLTGLILSCMLIFVMASLYEGIKWFRVYLQMSSADQPPNIPTTTMSTTSHLRPVGTSTPTPLHHQEDNRESLLEDAQSNGTSDLMPVPTFTPSVSPPPSRPPPTSVSFYIRNYSKADSPFAPMRLVQGFLYMVQLTLAYWLMLIAMTYNSWLTAAVVTGAAFGHWLFAVLKCLNPHADHLDSFAADACH